MCEATKQPSVILVVVDALRTDHLHCFGYSRNTSPFLYKLSQEAIFFENVISQSSWTKTSMPSLLASLYPEAHGVRGANDVLPDKVLLLPEILKEHGYMTCCIQRNPWMKEKFGFNQGYDKFLYSESRDAEQVNKQALTLFDEYASQPFFLYLHYMDVHPPYNPPREFDIFGETAEDKYDGEILYIDTKIEELLREFRKRNIAGNTWIIITADHGEEFMEHGKKTHGKTLYAEVLKVPLIFYNAENVKEAKRVKRQVRLIDITPTILDLLNITIPKSMEGVSLKKNIVDSSNFRGEDLEAFSQVGLNGQLPNRDLIAVTTPEFKYIFDFIGKKEELYNLRTDPWEKYNIFLSRPSIINTFREKVTRFLKLQQEKKCSFIEKTEIDEELKKKLKSLGYLK